MRLSRGPGRPGRSRRIGAALTSILLLASCGDSTGPSGPPGLAGRVGPAGGTVVGGGGAVSLTFPAGAVSAETDVTVEEADLSDHAGTEAILPGTAWVIGPRGLVFERPVEVELRYRRRDLPEGVGEEALAVFERTDRGWHTAPGGSVDPVADRVRALVDSLGVRAVGVDPCARSGPVPLEGTVEGELEEGDCQIDQERLQDRYTLVLNGLTAFIASVTTTSFQPLLEASSVGGRRVTGISSAGSTVSAFHVLPAGRYDILVSTRERRSGPDTPWPGGRYLLTVQPSSTDPAGCVPFAFLWSGVSVDGRIAEDDCELVGDGEPDVLRWYDGYVLFVREGETVTATVRGDFPHRAWFRNASLGVTLEEAVDLPPGATTSFAATADVDAFYGLYPISEHDRGTGTYTVTMEASGGPAPR